MSNLSICVKKKKKNYANTFYYSIEKNIFSHTKKENLQLNNRMSDELYEQCVAASPIKR